MPQYKITKKASQTLLQFGLLLFFILISSLSCGWAANASQETIHLLDPTPSQSLDWLPRFPEDPTTFNLTQPQSTASVSLFDQTISLEPDSKLFQLSDNADPVFKLREDKMELGQNTAQQTIKNGGLLHFLKGKPAQDAIMLGLWSRHIFTRKHFRQTNNLIGIQFHGIFAGTFSNSYSQQTFTAGFARTLLKKELFGGLNYCLGYKIGPMYGYYRGVPNIHGFTILPMLVNEITFKHVGVDFNLVPGKAFSLNLRFTRTE